MLSRYPKGLIVIHSGEGTEGTFVRYRGTRTARAIKSRLTRERCGGDRWAHAYVYSHDNEGGKVYVGLSVDDQKHISDVDIE